MPGCLLAQERERKRERERPVKKEKSDETELSEQVMLRFTKMLAVCLAFVVQSISLAAFKQHSAE
jgi:hypothetical protein